MKFSCCILFLGLLFSGNLLRAQKESTEWSSNREKWVLPGTDSLLLDSLPVVLSRIRLTDTENRPLPFNYKITGTTYRYLVFASPPADTLKIHYQILPVNLNRSFRNKDSTLIIPEITALNPRLYESDRKQAFRPFEGLNSKGSISRSITVGNNQDAVLNSSLNLQLAGKISSETEIRASITDNNIPVQSDGYTQQLREFDRVYIELENADFGLLRAGDYNMTSVKNHFLQFDKRISGAGVFTRVPLSEGEIPLIAQGGIARGKFARNRFQGQEGNQGPYKLTGANGERFVIIISGSERVYIDGVLMRRGEQYDYIMDYNAGEITFTALQPVNKERRIVVEFQYTEQNYLRSVTFGSTGYQNDRIKINAQFYSEQDSKNQSLVQDLSDEEKRVLSRAGDNLDQAIVNTIRPASFQNDVVLYELRDSLGYDSVLVFSVDSTVQLYQASFTYVGERQGNYVVAQQNSANGRAFRWVAPVNGIPQGNYAPVKQLVAPNQLQIFTLETEALITPRQRLRVDMAASKNDINLFSESGEQNDVGGAGKLDYTLEGQWSKARWLTNLRYEFNQANFRTVERIRNVEFARDWNLPLNYNGAVSLAGGSFALLGDSSRIKYDLDYLTFTRYSGIRNTLSASARTGENIGNAGLSWLHSEDSTGSSDFLREMGEFTHFITPGYWIGLRSVGELNRRLAHQADTLSRNSYQFLEYEIFTGLGDTTQSFAELSYLQRFDDTAAEGRYQRFSVVNAYGLRSAFHTNFNSRLELFGNVRNLKIYIPETEGLQRTITSRANYVQRLFGNAITSTTFYETGSGTEPRRSFSYIEVPAGTGTYTHTDYNGNGIKELDEFEVAPTPDLARYIRVFTPSSEYLRTSLNKFGENLNINAPVTWQSTEDFRRTVARFSILFNYQLDRKTLLEGNSNILNPFGETADSNIVALNNSFRNTLFFNRTATKFGMDYTYRITDNRTLMNSGIERRGIYENSVNLRYQVIDPLLFRVMVAFIEKNNYSEYFSRRNFEIDAWNNEFSLAYQPADQFVVTGKYLWRSETGMADQNVSLNSRDFGIEVNYNTAENFAVLAQADYILNEFTGNSSNPAAFEMLQALRPGKNATWMLTLQKTIRKNILVSLNYNGRISEDSFPIQTGSLQVKAFF